MTRTGDSEEVISRWRGDWRAEVTAGPFTLLVDEPEADGGSFTGPMPTEYLLASLASCYTLAIAWAARRRRVELGDLEVRAVGEYNGPRYERFRLRVVSSLPADDLEPLLEMAGRVCYVSNTLSQPPQIEVEQDGDDGRVSSG